MSQVLVIGGTRFIGRHVVADLLDHGYDITLLTRGNRENPFAEADRVDHIEGDRTNRSTIERAADTVSPEIVVDSVAFFPDDVRTAIDVFSDVDRYVYISSVGAYDEEHVLKYEDSTPLVPCSDEQATDDSFGTYENRKAEGDRILLDAAEEGAPAISVRPSMVYGPYNHLGFLQYWIDRTINNDRLIVPGDGTFLCHRTYVEDIASAIRILVESGEPGEVYNIGDQRPLTMDQTIDLISSVSGSEVEPVYASRRELAREGLSRRDFPLYMDEPFVMSTEKLSSLGWTSTPVEQAMDRTIGYYRQTELDDYEMGPPREDEQKLIDTLS